MNTLKIFEIPEIKNIILDYSIGTKEHFKKVLDKCLPCVIDKAVEVMYMNDFLLDDSMPESIYYNYNGFHCSYKDRMYEIDEYIGDFNHMNDYQLKWARKVLNQNKKLKIKKIKK